MSWLRPGHPADTLLQGSTGENGFEEVDRAFVLVLLQRVRPTLPAAQLPVLALALALLSRAAGERQVCLPLDGLARQASDLHPEQCATLAQSDWRTLLLESGLCAQPPHTAPLVLDHADRLYLLRHFVQERQLAHDLLALCQGAPPELDPDEVRHALAAAFPVPGRQRAAAALALHSRLLLLTGGPGTGKTTTMSRILELLRRFWPSLAPPGAGSQPRIMLAAPTGKAAARMQQALAASPTLDCAPLAAPLTLHRLLGLRPDSERAAYTRERPLELDLLVVDEASMVDLSLMARLLEALPAGARLILLGDRDQLSSVEAGSVLADLCPEDDSLSPELAHLLESWCGMEQSLPRSSGGPALPTRDHRMHLDHSHRFAAESPIGRASTALRQGDGETLLQILDHENESGLSRRDLPGARELPGLLSGFLPAPGSLPADAEQLLALWESRQILCALNLGPLGVDAVNRFAAQHFFGERADLALGAGAPGMPLMVVGNAAERGLFNGDGGVFLLQDGQLLAAFREGHSVRLLPAALLPPWKPAWAITIHKSQGSEYARVLVLLPDQSRRVLCRELVYTALSRARESLQVLASRRTLLDAAATRLERSSGLRDALSAFAEPVR